MEREGPFCLLRPLANRPTQRVCKLSTELDALSKEHDQRCFPGPHGDQQLEAFQGTRDELLHSMQDLQQHTMAGVLGQLQKWAVQSAGDLWPQQQDTRGRSSDQHQQPSSDTGAAGLLPTAALSLASSTNTAEAYAHLLCTLKQQGHPTALVTAREAGTGLAAVTNSAMRQFLGAPSAADDIPALLAWWQDECQPASGSRGNNAGHNSRHGPAGPAATPAKATAASQVHTSSGAGAADMDVDANQQTPATDSKRQLRSRSSTASKTPGGRQGGQAAAGGGGGAAAAAPLQVPVLVLQDADSVDAESLEELVVALHEARQAGLPLVLVLGITSSHQGLLQLLPNSILRRIQLLQLALPPAWQQLARFYRAVLLCGPQPRLVLGPKCAAWLLQHFRDVDASASMAQRAIQLACVEHHLQQPLSCLAPAAAFGTRSKLHAAIQGLPREQLLRCCSALVSAAAQASTDAQAQQPLLALQDPATAPAGSGGSSSSRQAAQQEALAHLQAAISSTRVGRGSEAAATSCASAAAVLEGAVWGAMTALQQWRLGLLMLSLVSGFTGVSELDASFQLPALYAAAQQAGFLAVTKTGVLSTCGQLLFKLLGGSSSSRAGGAAWPAKGGVVPVDRLTDAECAQLLAKLLQLLAAAQQGRPSSTSRRRKRGGSSSNEASEGLEGSAAAAGSGSDGSSSSDSSDCSDSSDDDEDSEAEEDADAPGSRYARPSRQTALTASPQVQRLLQTLTDLHTITAAAATAGALAAAEAAAAAGLPASEHQQHLQASLESFCTSHAALLAPLPEQLLLPPPAAAEATDAGDADDMQGVEAAAAELGLLGTPAGRRGGAGSGPGSARTPLPTPGALASALRKRVRFAPDTPDHAAAKAAGPSRSAKSTPDDEEKPPGLIKTPNKRSSSADKKPRKKLFDSRAAGSAAAAAAAGASSGKPSRRSRQEKQEAAVGDVAGSRASALAAVAAAAAAGGAAAAAAGGGGGGGGMPLGNKRHARLLGMMANTYGSMPAGAGAGAGGANASDSPAAAGKPGIRSSSRRQQQQAAGLLLSPTADSPVAGRLAGASSSPEELPDSPAAAAAAAAAATAGRSRLHASSSNTDSPAGAAAAAITAGDGGSPAAAAAAAAGFRSPTKGRAGVAGSKARSSSRLARKTDAAQDMDVQQQQPRDEPMQLEQQQEQQDARNAAAPALSCAAVLAQLLASVIPRLMLGWSLPSSSDSTLHQDLSSSILKQQEQGGRARGGSSGSSSGDNAIAAAAAAAVAAGTSLASAGAAAAFTFDDLRKLEQHLAPAAPAALHTAMVAPGLHLQGHPFAVGDPGWEDTCLAYVLLQQQRDDGMPVSDWFGLFCEALNLKGFTQQDASAAAAGGGRGGGKGRGGDDEAGGKGVVGAAAGRAQRSKARHGSKARGYADARAASASAANEPAAAAAGGSNGQTPNRRGQQQQQGQDQDQDRGVPLKSGKKRGSSTVAAAAAAVDRRAGQQEQQQLQQQTVDQQELLSAAARFSQAAAELQLLGVWKGTKRRRAAGVLRVFAPEGPALPSMAAAAAAAAGVVEDGDEM